MTYEEIKKYLYSDCIVRNEEFEYKTEGEEIFCRDIGTLKWNDVYSIGKYEKEMEWELVGKKIDSKLENIQQFISYAQKEGVISNDIMERLLKFSNYYTDSIDS